MSEHLDIVMPAWRDAHLHLRQDQLLSHLAEHSRLFCSDVVVMPNTNPPIDSPERLRHYTEICRKYLGERCRPLVTIYLTRDMTVETVKACREAGAFAIKIYPAHGTTNSDHGWIRDDYISLPDRVRAIFAYCQEVGMPILWHGELPEMHFMQAEAAFLSVFTDVASRYPDLKMVMEHVTDAWSIHCLRSLRSAGRRVACTITMHHLWLQWTNDVLKPKFKPDWFHMPLPKGMDDWMELLRAVLEDWAFLGTDSAAHSTPNKYAAECCAGCFTACHPEMLLVLFQRYHLLEHLTAFTSERMAAFYELEPGPTFSVRFWAEPWQVPSMYSPLLVPFLHDQILPWQLDRNYR